MSDTIENRILDILSEETEIDRDKLTLQTNLEEAGVDSLTMVEIIFKIEETFDITIPDPEDINEQFKDFRTPADVIALIQSLVNAKVPA